MMTAFIGLENSAIECAKALETKPRLPVIWLRLRILLQRKFIRSSHFPFTCRYPNERHQLDYTETLMAASGVQAEQAIEKHYD